MDNGPQYSSTTSRLASKQSSSHDSHQTPWTASRCHRLLRPLLAHIASLRKETVQRELQSGLEDSTRSAAGKRASQDGTSCGPAKKKRKMCNQYSSRASRPRVSLEEEPYTPQRPQAPLQQRIAANRPAQPIVMPTPFLRRVRNHEMSSPLPPAEPDDALPGMGEPTLPHPGGRAHSVYSNRLSRLRGKLSAERLRLQESVLHALDALLVATCPRKTAVAAPKSLMAMCLRKVPECIAELEWWEQKEAEENGTKSTMSGSQISMEIYSDLENLGATDGWRHLCVVVRAHGVRIVQEAVRERLFDDAVTELLVKVCVEHLPLVECEGLVDSFIFRQYPGPTTARASLSEPEAMRPLAILSSLDRADSHFRMRKLGELFASGMLPTNWALADDFKAMWAPAVLLLTKSLPSHQDVAGFMAIAMEQFCRLESAQRQPGPSEGDTGAPSEIPGRERKVLVSVIASLVSIPLLAKERDEPTGAAEEKIAALDKRVRYILETCIANIRSQRTGRKYRVSTYALSLCAFLALDDEDAIEAIEVAWRRGHPRAENPTFLYDITAAIVGTTAHFVGRASHFPTHRHLSRLCDKLETLDLPGDAFSNLQVDSAFVRAELSGNLPDLAYAESLQAKNTKSKQAQHNWGGHDRRSATGAETKSAYAGFRWDDDMGEWVVAGSSSQATVKPSTSRPRRSTRVSLSQIEPTPRSFNLILRAPSTSSVAEQDDVSLPSAPSETSDASEYDDHESIDEELVARSPPTTETSPTSTSSPPPQTLYSRSPRRSRRSIVNPDSDSDSDSEFINDSSPAPQPRHRSSSMPRQCHTTRVSGRPSRLSRQPSVESSSEDDELGQDAGSGRRPPLAPWRGRVAAVRKQGVMRRSRSISLLSLAGPESSGDELSFV